MAEDGNRQVRMPLAVRAARFVRHGAGLRSADWLWNAIRPLYRRALALTGGSKGITIEIAGLGPVRLPASYLQEDVPAGELPGLAALLNNLHASDVFYDVGASVGMYSFFALNRLAASGEIHAFEPDENSCRALLAHLATVEPGCTIAVNRAFLSDVTTCEPACLGFSAAQSGSGAGTRHLYLFQAADAALAQQCRLDDYVRSGHRPPTFVKCDIEGAELLFLRGAESTLAEHRPVLLLSVHPELLGRFGHSVEQVRQYLSDRDYRIRQLNDDGELHWICEAL